MVCDARCKGMMKCAALLLAGCLVVLPARAQHTIGYVDSDYILQQLPEYATVQQKLDRMVQQWEDELGQQQEQVEALEQEFEARELLYTDEERRERQAAIDAAREEAVRLREQYFGPEGQLYTEQRRLMRPVQERVLTAVEQVAQDEGYDYILDKSSDLIFMFAREEHDLSATVLQELGIDVEGAMGGGR